MREPIEPAWGLRTCDVQRGNEPVCDSDGYLDAEGQWEAMQAIDGITVEEITETMRDCADGIRARYALPAVAQKDAA